MYRLNISGKFIIAHQNFEGGGGVVYLKVLNDLDPMKYLPY